jgi:hypothetical protein
MRHKNLLLPLICVIILFFRLYRSDSINFDIDVLAKGLIPVKTRLKQVKTMGFYTNANDYQIYESTRYIIAPCLLLNQPDLDTILMIRDNKSALKQLPHYKVIVQNADADKTFSVLIKTK